MIDPLPLDWSIGSVRDLAGADGLATDGDWVETKDQDPNGAVRLIQLADIGDGHFLDRSSRYMTMEAASRLRCTFLKQGDLLVARMPDPLGRACIFPGLACPAVTAVDVFVWRAGIAGADPSWLMHVINSPDVRSSLAMLAGGTTRQRVSGGNVKRLNLPAPPLAEQRRIVARIEALFARTRRARADLERIAPLARQYRSRALSIQIGKSADGSRARTVTDLLTETATNGISVRGSDDPPGTPALRLDALTANGLDLTRIRYIVIPPRTVERLAIHDGDFFVSRGNGSMRLLAKGAFAREPAIPTVFPDTMIRLRFRGDIVHPEWLMFAWGSDAVRSQIERKAKTTAGIWKVSQSDLGSIKLSIPNLEEQRGTAHHLQRQFAVTEKTVNEAVHALALLDRLEQSILARAFRGELLPQDLSEAAGSASATTADAEQPARVRRRRAA